MTPADEVEAVFHAALKAGDAQGVVDALTVMATIDLGRCVKLHDALTTSLAVAKVLSADR